jgi:hypothetical protein
MSAMLEIPVAVQLLSMQTFVPSADIVGAFTIAMSEVFELLKLLLYGV